MLFNFSCINGQFLEGFEIFSLKKLKHIEDEGNEGCTPFWLHPWYQQKQLKFIIWQTNPLNNFSSLFSHLADRKSFALHSISHKSFSFHPSLIAMWGKVSKKNSDKFFITNCRALLLPEWEENGNKVLILLSSAQNKMFHAPWHTIGMAFSTLKNYWNEMREKDFYVSYFFLLLYVWENFNQ